jgi:hypothetical protein
MPNTWANTWGDLPEDDPIFTGGVRFVFGRRRRPRRMRTMKSSSSLRASPGDG